MSFSSLFFNHCIKTARTMATKFSEVSHGTMEHDFSISILENSQTF